MHFLRFTLPYHIQQQGNLATVFVQTGIYPLIHSDQPVTSESCFPLFTFYYPATLGCFSFSRCCFFRLVDTRLESQLSHTLWIFCPWAKVHVSKLLPSSLSCVIRTCLLPCWSFFIWVNLELSSSSSTVLPGKETDRTFSVTDSP